MNIFNQGAIGAKKSPFIYRDQATLEIRSGGGCLSVFGLPFLLAGLFVLQLPLDLIPVNKPSDTPSSLFVILFGAVFTLVGALLVFGRAGIILDRARGRIVQWYGLLVPFKRTEYLMDAIDQVEMSFSSGDSDSPATWPIKLSGGSMTKPLAVSQPTSFAGARQLAEELSRFLQKPLVDTSTGERIIRDPGHLNESYRDRMKRVDKAEGILPPKPSTMRSRVERTGEGLVIHIPENTNKKIYYIPLAFSLIFAIGVTWFFMPPLLRSDLPDLIRYLILGFLGLFIIVPLISAIRTAHQMKKDFERITVTRAFLRVEAIRQGKKTMTEIPIDELEDLVAPARQETINIIEVSGMKKVKLGDTGTPRMPDGRPVPRLLSSLMKMAGSKGIIARSDKTEVELAAGLDEAEVAWLFALIRKTITE